MYNELLCSSKQAFTAAFLFNRWHKKLVLEKKVC